MDAGQISIIVGPQDNASVGTPASFRTTLVAPIALAGGWEMCLLNCSRAKATVGNFILVTCSAVETQNVGSGIHCGC